MHGPPWNALLPRPHVIRPSSGEFELSERSQVRLPAELAAAEVEASSDFVLAPLRAEGREFCVGSQVGWVPASRVELSIAPTASEGEPSISAQGYRLKVTPDRAVLVGRSARGLFHGLRTLTQIATLCGTRWPCVEIVDEPDFAQRGLMLDVSRGKVPTLETLKHLVDRMAGLKLNQLQLYVEHTFDFQFDPDIARGCDPLTADEIRALDAYGRERYVDLVPCLALCGHMGRVLSLPQYRHLAEIEATKPWEQMNWFERGRGFTLDVRNPQSRALIEKMVAEYLPLFSAPYFNVCCDETYDLGKGKTAHVAAERGIGKLYIEHLTWLHELAARYGKRVMFWGDIMRKYPELIREIPRDAIVLNWGYEADFDFDSTGAFTRAGLDPYVCPSTWSFARLLSALNVAEANIRGHAAAGKRLGATGLLNTHWGDHGHINTLADSWHAIALGADASWNASSPVSSEQFDRAFSTHFFGDFEAKLLQPLRRLATLAGTCATWRILYSDFAGDTLRDPLPNSPTAEAIGAAAREALAVLDEYAGDGHADPADLMELRLACRLAALLSDKVHLRARLDGQPSAGAARPPPDSMGRDTDLAQRSSEFADAIDALLPSLCDAWKARNKASSLDDVVSVLRRLSESSRRLADRA